MIEFAAFAYLAIIVAVIGFQCCLMAGAPWGRITQGGRHEGALPRSGRLIAAVSVPILLCMGAGVASAAGLLESWPRWAVYVGLGVQALSTLLNWITPSRAERRLWGPITTAMLLLAAYVVFGAPSR